MCFDGILCFGSVRKYVERVPIMTYSIEGYNEDSAAIIHLCSKISSLDEDYDIWYELKEPSGHYREFHDAFQWVANFGILVIDFLATPDTRISLQAFRKDFYQWLLQRIEKNDFISDWLQAFGNTTDFCKAVAAHIDYLGQQAFFLPDSESLLDQPLWMDCMKEDHPGILQQPIIANKTICSPHTFACFRSRYFRSQLQEIEPSSSVQEAQQKRLRRMGFPYQTSVEESKTHTFRIQTGPYKVGDVVAMQPDEGEMGLWGASTEKHWLGYVQRVEVTNKGQRLFVLWLYYPEQTTIHVTDYPVRKELFLSDHCNCNEAVLLESDIVRKYSVEWFSRRFDTPKDFLVRQTYFQNEQEAFVSLRNAHFTCACKASSRSTTEDYNQGDTFYIECRSFTLEPVVIDFIDHIQARCRVRRLARRRDNESPTRSHSSSFPPNEVLWTDDLIIVPLNRIKRKCFVRYFAQDKRSPIPFPYDRDGAGDYWILSSYLRTAGDMTSIEPLDQAPPALRQGQVPSVPRKLPGLSLFSGLGNLDKGLETSGSVEFHTAVDMFKEAIYTMRANSEHPEKLNLWFGSVDDYLQALLSGDERPLIAKIGTVDFIAAGSPCPGFSSLQQKPNSEQSLRNASHITTFCSAVDLYRPQYGCLENVVNIGTARKGFENEHPLSQTIACLVSMGYQVQQRIESSWNFGSPQQRSRVILSIAAPGLTPLVLPQYTHSHPSDQKSRSLGRLQSGVKYGVRDIGPTPFGLVSAGEATSHLPNIGNGRLHTCIQSPDHRLIRPVNAREKHILYCIPKTPAGMGLAAACKLNLIPQHLVEGRKKHIGRSFTRIRKDGLIGTIVTSPSVTDGWGGPYVHWEQDRGITLEEARISQGIPQTEVLIGPISSQFKMVGNAVDRHIAEQYGLGLLKAMQQNTQRLSIPNSTAPVGVSLKSPMVVIPNLTVRSKRAFDGAQQNTRPNADDGIHPRNASRKRTKYLVKMESPEKDEHSVASLESTVDSNSNVQNEHRIFEGKSRRKTRHSGAVIEYTPYNWDQVIEKNIKTERRGRIT